MKIQATSHGHHPTENGYVMLIAIFLMAILTIAMSVATPVVIRQIQLDRERETMERGKQYRRAIQLYYRKFHAYPPSVNALEMTNNIRFLRKKYTDPMTGKVDWQPILFGQNRVPTAMGFFGQPLSGAGPIGGSTLAGTGPSGGNSQSSGSLPGGISDIFGGSTNGSTSANISSGSGAGAPGGSGGSTGVTTSMSGTSSTGGTGSSTNTDQSGPTFGGAGIIGFSPGSTKQSIMLYKKKDRFDEWEFTYDPLGDPAMLQGSAQAIPPPGTSLVGVGAGPNGTGPLMSPDLGAPASNNHATQ